VTPTQADTLARRIADRLFTSAIGEHGDRLAILNQAGLTAMEREIGGWTYEAAVQQIRDVLMEMAKVGGGE
jgi:hypothetical protein